MRPLGKFVAFDIGSTLVQASPGEVAGLIAQGLHLSRMQVSRLNDALMTRPFSSADEVAEWMTTNLDSDTRLTEEAVARVWHEQKQAAKVVEGAPETLRDLAAAGFGLALLSNIWLPYMESVRTAFAGLIDELIPRSAQLLSFELGTAKPDLSMFERLRLACGAEEGDVVMVGDTYDVDIDPAIRLGMRTIWVLQRPERETGSLVGVLNGTRRPPTRAVSTVADIVPSIVSDVLTGASCDSNAGAR